MLNDAQKNADREGPRQAVQRNSGHVDRDVPTAPIFQGTLYLFSQKGINGIKISPTLQFIYGAISKD
jgi:hypothetical protein